MKNTICKNCRWKYGANKRKCPTCGTPKQRTIKQLKKECWELFSLYIRTRDCMKTTGSSSWGFCVTCGKRYHIKLLQAGHFIPGRHNANLFSEKGTHGQCYNCNINLRGNTQIYRRKINEMYGEDYDLVLEAEDKKKLKFTRQFLEDKLNDLQDKLNKLKGGVG